MANITITKYSWTARVMELEGGIRVPVAVLDIFPDSSISPGDYVYIPNLAAPPTSISALVYYLCVNSVLENVWSGAIPRAGWTVGRLSGSTQFTLGYRYQYVYAAYNTYEPEIYINGSPSNILQATAATSGQCCCTSFLVRDANTNTFWAGLSDSIRFYCTSTDTTRNALGIVRRDNALLGVMFDPDEQVSNYRLIANQITGELQTILQNMARPNTDPYDPGGSTTPSGPNTGTWTIVNNDVDFPELPAITASDTGFFSIWVPTLEQIQLLARFMWTTDITNIDFWKRLVTSPLELILGLSLFPVDLDTDGHESLTLGLIDTRIDTNYRNAQFVDVDCGELDLEEYYGAFLDYAPFTQLDVYLPYIGVRTINVNDVMPKRLHLRYRIDLVSGSCVAMLKADNSVFYHWTGSCSVSIPVTTQQMRDLIQGAVSAAGAVASGILTGGLTGALAAASGVASAAANSSQHVGRSGSMGSAAGFLGVQTPYLIITRPRQAIPEDQNHYTGYPTFITAELGDLTGYTEVEAVHLHDIPATSDELDEIERLLREGVIL